MSALIGRHGVLACALVTMAAATAPALAETVSINVDQARVMRLPERVATIVIGNPLIADATLQAGGIVILTGKGFGSTNMLALDRAGKVVLDNTLHVMSPTTSDLVVVYRGAERESYSCAPDCERRITLGDAQTYFNTTLEQTVARNGNALGNK